jgi:hypothetical protein
MQPLNALEKWVYDLTHGTTAFPIQLLAGILRADSIPRSKVQPAKKIRKLTTRDWMGTGDFGLPSTDEFEQSVVPAFLFGRKLFGARVTELDIGDGAALDTYSFGKQAVHFVPHLNGLRSSWHVIDLKCTALTADREVGMADDTNVRPHPSVNVTTKAKHDFFRLGAKLRNDARSCLPHIDIVVVVGHAVHIVLKRVVIPDLESLADSHTNNAGNVDTATLVENDRLAGYGRLRKCALQFHEGILQTAIRGGKHSLLNHAFSGVDAATHRIDAHSNHGISGGLSAETNVPFNGTHALY